MGPTELSPGVVTVAEEDALGVGTGTMAGGVLDGALGVTTVVDGGDGFSVRLQPIRATVAAQRTIGSIRFMVSPGSD
jgi:hypothetical protein